MKCAGLMSGTAGRALIAILALAAAANFNASGQALAADPADYGELLGALKATSAVESPLVHETDEGFIRFIGAPRGGNFAARQAAGAGNAAEGAAKNFVADHAGAFGVENGRVGFTTSSSVEHLGQTIVRMDQSYGGLPVFGAETVVTVNADGSVANVLSDVLRDTRTLDAGDVGLSPAIDADTAIQRGKTGLASELGGVTSSSLTAENDPALTVYAPSVLGLNGSTTVAWRFILAGNGPEGPIRREVFVDAQSGAVALSYSLIHDALFRIVSDFNTGAVLRAEGDPPSGNVEADNAYDYLGDTYNYFFEQQQRDGIDDFGSPLLAVVGLPIANAFWDGFQMQFGEGFVVDDVTAHELTHGVTEYTANLIYQGFSGAINESMSDIWGEIIDQNNGRGNDEPQVRWQMGEEVVGFGAIRDMRDPTRFGHPDRLDSPLLFNVNSPIDGGGVHINSGIGNKLAYLLTDGDTFNGETVTGLGHEIVTDLFYGCLLTLSASADYYDLYFALEATALSMDLTNAQRCNIFAACNAVSIVPPSAFQPVSQLKATNARQQDGSPAIVLTWNEPMKICANPVTISRRNLGLAKGAGSVIIAQNATSAVLDTDVAAGNSYEYMLEAPGATPDTPIILIATVIAGEDPAPVITEAYDNDPSTSAQPVDLSFSQITYAPTGAPASTFGGIRDYDVTIKRNVSQFPVRRSDSQGASITVPMSYQGGALLPFSDLFGLATAFQDFRFPFFDNVYTRLYIGANGYISFNPIQPFSALNEATLVSHHSVPRVAFLFGDLAPDSFGEVWVRDMADRAVITFAEVPENVVGAFTAGSSVQVELFKSGQIRFTYQSVSANNIIVGLSDGSGAPVNPAELFPAMNLMEQPTQSDFTAKPLLPERLSLAPIVPPVANGNRVEFMVDAILPASLSNGDPEFIKLFGPGVLVDLGNSARYILDAVDSGLYTVRVQALLGDQRAFQDVRFAVNASVERPTATNVMITSNVDIVDGELESGHPIAVSYTYNHSLAESDPANYGEGPSLITWYRNGQQVVSLTNQRVVPSSKLLAEDEWQFRVTPVTASFLAGAEVSAPVIHILGGPQIDSVTPAFGLITGGARVSIKGSGLNGPLSVKFGGVKAASYQVISDNEITAITPVHSAGAVNVEVATGRGTGVLEKAFRFLEDTGDVVIGDVNGDGRVDALDVQLVVGTVLELTTLKSGIDADANEDGTVNAADVQFVVNRALYR